MCEHPARVLTLTTFDLGALVHAALRAGASGLVLEDTSPDDPFHAVRSEDGDDTLIVAPFTRQLPDHSAGSVTSIPSATAVQAVELLTDRERGVLQLIAQGLSNREIGALMFVAYTTVKSHVGRIFVKLAARNRVQATMIAYESHLVVPGTN